METMEELKKAGKIRAIGLSNFSLEEMKAAMKFGQVDVIQPCYSLLWRYDEALLEFSRKQEISVIPYSTLAQGLLTGKYQKGAVFTDGRARAALFQPETTIRCLEVTDVLSQISAKYGKTPAQGAATAIHLALSDEAKDRNGCCYANCKKRNVSERIRHHAQQKQLWDDTEILLRQKGIRF